MPKIYINGINKVTKGDGLIKLLERTILSNVEDQSVAIITEQTLNTKIEESNKKNNQLLKQVKSFEGELTQSTLKVDRLS